VASWEVETAVATLCVGSRKEGTEPLQSISMVRTACLTPGGKQVGGSAESGARKGRAHSHLSIDGA